MTSDWEILQESANVEMKRALKENLQEKLAKNMFHAVVLKSLDGDVHGNSYNYIK